MAKYPEIISKVLFFQEEKETFCLAKFKVPEYE
jgi:hypothetical protein